MTVRHRWYFLDVGSNWWFTETIWAMPIQESMAVEQQTIWLYLSMQSKFYQLTLFFSGAYPGKHFRHISRKNWYYLHKVKPCPIHYETHFLKTKQNISCFLFPSNWWLSDFWVCHWRPRSNFVEHIVGKPTTLIKPIKPSLVYFLCLGCIFSHVI